MSVQRQTGPVTIPAVQARKQKTGAAPLPMLTAYDATMAKTLVNAGVELLLVGDSLAMTLLGHENTLSLTMADMLHHVKAVSRGVQQASRSAIVVADMPFLSYGVSVEESVKNAGRMIQEGGAQAVKLEGASPTVCETIRRCVALGIPVMGHVGLTPQSIHQLGGFKLQGKVAHQARQLLQDALRLQQCGVFSIVLEMVPVEVAQLMTQTLDVPTIGIGAGHHCDGQVLVIDDLLGRDSTFMPKFLRRYADLETTITQAVQQYQADVLSQAFPSNVEEAYALPEDSRDAVLLAMREVLPMETLSPQEVFLTREPRQGSMEERMPCAN